MKDALSNFEKWFKAQFGALPTELRPHHEILQDLIKARKSVSDLERELYEQTRIHHSWQASQYAGNASKKNFDF